MNPSNLKYHKEHDWARIEGDLAVFGVTHYAQESLGDIVYIELPEVGTELTAGSPTPRWNRSRRSRMCTLLSGAQSSK